MHTYAHAFDSYADLCMCLRPLLTCNPRNFFCFFVSIAPKQHNTQHTRCGHTLSTKVRVPGKDPKRAHCMAWLLSPVLCTLCSAQSCSTMCPICCLNP